MNARQFYSFSTELLKMSADIKNQPEDAEIRAAIAERRGETYLLGGKLPSNSIEDEGQDYAIKLGNAGNIAGGVYDLSARKKRNNTAQHARDYTAAGAKGAFVGLGAVEAHRKLLGHFHRPEGLEASKMKGRFRLAAGLGAGLSIAERAWRHRHLPTQGGEVKAAMVTQKFTNNIASPAQKLRQGQQVGMFEGKIHTPRVTQFAR